MSPAKVHAMRRYRGFCRGGIIAFDGRHPDIKGRVQRAPTLLPERPALLSERPTLLSERPTLLPERPTLSKLFCYLACVDVDVIPILRRCVRAFWSIIDHFVDVNNIGAAFFSIKVDRRLGNF